MAAGSDAVAGTARRERCGWCLGRNISADGRGMKKLLHALRRAEVSVCILFYFCWSISRALISRKTSVFSITPLKLYAPAP